MSANEGDSAPTTMTLWKKLESLKVSERRKEVAVPYSPGALQTALKGSLPSGAKAPLDYVPIEPCNFKYMAFPLETQFISDEILEVFGMAGNYSLEYVQINKYIERVKISDDGRRALWQGKLADIRPSVPDPLGPDMDAWIFTSWYAENGYRPEAKFRKPGSEFE